MTQASAGQGGVRREGASPGRPAAGGPEAVLSLDRVSRDFGEVQALREVSVTFRAGEVHAVLGANGSGKSTLVKVMSGVHAPSSGTLRWGPEAMTSLGPPSRARALGIRVVHQEAPLIDNLSVLEAVATFQGYGTSGIRRISWRQLRRRVAGLLESLNLSIGLDELCGRVGPADRAGLALAIALQDFGGSADPGGGRARLLILDEATAALPESDAERHLARIRAVAASGVAVVMVTHRLGELSIADDVTMLRAGEVVYHQGHSPRRSVPELLQVMVVPAVGEQSRDEQSADAPSRGGGDSAVRRLWATAPIPRSARRGAVPAAGRDGLETAPAVELTDVAGQRLSGLTLSCPPGEIVGFVGLPESGIRDLPRMLMGAAAPASGTIRVGGRQLRRQAGPRELLRAGVMSVPADRLREGGVGSLTVTENVILPAPGPYWHKRARRDRVVQTVIEAFDVRPPRPQTLFGTLSGGNQQKILLGKWLLLRPAVLVLNDPTYGVDPVARERIFDAIRDAAAQSVCVLFFSSEPEQLIRICHRVVVVRDGTVAADLHGADLTHETLMEWSYA